MKVSDWGYTVLGGGALWKHMQSLSWVSSTFAKAHFEKRNYDNSPPSSLTISKQPFYWALETSEALFSYRRTIYQSTWLFLCQWMFSEGRKFIFWGYFEIVALQSSPDSYRHCDPTRESQRWQCLSLLCGKSVREYVEYYRQCFLTLKPTFSLGLIFP